MLKQKQVKCLNTLAESSSLPQDCQKETNRGHFLCVRSMGETI